MLQIPADRMSVVPLGINLTGYERASSGAPARRSLGEGGFRVGYFARDRAGEGAARARRRLQAAARDRHPARRCGSTPPATWRARRRRTWTASSATSTSAGLAEEFTYHGAVDRDGKLAFLQTLDVLSVPAPYDEPKGVFLLEAMGERRPGRAAAARRVHRNRREDRRRPARRARRSGGARRWAATACGRIARSLERLALRGFAGVREHYSIAALDRSLAGRLREGDGRIPPQGGNYRVTFLRPVASLSIPVVSAFRRKTFIPIPVVSALRRKISISIPVVSAFRRNAKDAVAQGH